MDVEDGEQCDGDPDDGMEDSSDEDPAVAAEAGPAGDSRQSLSKSELFKAYKTVGPHKMYMDIMCDDDLRSAAEIIVQVGTPLHEQYRTDLKSQKDGVDSMLEWCAQRALASTQLTVIEIFKVQGAKTLFSGLRLPYCNPPLPYDKCMQHDIDITEKACKFATHLAANYGWGEMLHYYTLPLAATSLIAKDVADRDRGMKHLKRLVEAIIEAEEMVQTNPSIQPLLTDLAFVEEPFAREIMILLKRSDYSLDSELANELQAAMVKFNSGSSSTKEILESTFAHLSYCVAASNKNKIIAPHLLWLYCTGSPYVEESGMSQLIPNKQDWLQHIGNYGVARTEQMTNFNKAFDASATPLPTAPDIAIPTSADGVSKTKWRLAGPASHYTSSAAAAYIVNDVKHGFKNCAFAWAGQQTNAKLAITTDSEVYV